MEKRVDYKVDAEGLVGGANLHDGYLYGVVQQDNGLIIYAEADDSSQRTIKLVGLTQMNVTDFWCGSIICDVWLWPRQQVPERMWEELFRNRIPLHDFEAKLKSSIERTPGRYFFALESSYGANVYAVCDELEITRPE